MRSGKRDSTLDNGVYAGFEPPSSIHAESAGEIVTVLNTLFGAEVPTSGHVDGSGGLQLGATFQVDRPARLAGFRCYGVSYRNGWSANPNGSDLWGVLRAADMTPLLAVPWQRTPGADAGAGDDWRDFWIHPRYQLAPATDYTFTVWLYFERYFTFDFRFATAWAHDHLAVAAPAGGVGNGQYRYDPNLFGALTPSVNAYGVDVLVETED